ncbi:hypothetical protein TSUD_139580 [Trifolium subterraneum]|uniref:Reverse transcriptase domain-containing protein n=1 Tax=Trifolium subterraneum TaxID=3900 RepID=A0A2Z6PHU2_TRISU|nr:hypothetical protein TSUD_139580 [Trifolium subterraneum]
MTGRGDPLSPYLFILYADVLSGLITKAKSDHLIHGVKIAPSAPEISQLLFADDSLMFCRATVEEANVIHNIILTYQRASGQQVNFSKSEMVFSKGISGDLKKDIANILPITIKEQFSKYLGMPTVMGRSKSQVFNFIQEKIWNKLKGWKEKNLSFAGRSTLIKAVAQAIPTYLMSSFLILKGNGGMGFRDLRAFNEALLAKQGWRLITQPSSLVAQVLKAKYYPKDQFLEAKSKNQMSYSWRSILQASWVIKKGSYWTIGSGDNINTWTDNWIHQRGNTTMWTPQPLNPNYVKVKNLMTNSTNEWNTHLINQIFIAHEAQQILKIPIIDRTQEDTLTWDGTMDGNYSVKSGYKAIMDWGINTDANKANSSNNPKDFWPKLWNLNVPPKHSHLIWRIINNALPVKGNIFKKGIQCDPLCPRCSTTIETCHHVFLECDWCLR